MDQQGDQSKVVVAYLEQERAWNKAFAVWADIKISQFIERSHIFCEIQRCLTKKISIFVPFLGHFHRDLGLVSFQLSVLSAPQREKISKPFVFCFRDGIK
jgi:hypothetical protein